MQQEKISDEEVIRLYNMGYNDRQISQIHNVSRSAVRLRRLKLGLVGIGINSKQSTPKELINTYKRRYLQHMVETKIKGRIATLLRKEHLELYNKLRNKVTQNK